MEQISRKREAERASDREVARLSGVTVEEFDADTTAADPITQDEALVPVSLLEMLVDGIESWLDGEPPPAAAYHAQCPLWEQPLNEAKAILEQAKVVRQ